MEYEAKETRNVFDNITCSLASCQRKLRMCLCMQNLWASDNLAQRTRIKSFNQGAVYSATLRISRCGKQKYNFLWHFGASYLYFFVGSLFLVVAALTRPNFTNLFGCIRFVLVDTPFAMTIADKLLPFKFMITFPDPSISLLYPHTLRFNLLHVAVSERLCVISQRQY